MSEVLAHGEGVQGEPLSRPIRLKEAREAAGLHIAALAAALKVPVKKLEALEAGRYSELPDLTFARALASSACRQLRVDPAPILQQIPLGSSLRLGEPGRSLNAPFNGGREHEPTNPPSWLSRPAFLVAVVLLLGALVIALLPQADSSRAPPVVSGPASVDPVSVEPVAAQEPVDAALKEGVTAVGPTGVVLLPGLIPAPVPVSEVQEPPRAVAVGGEMPASASSPSTAGNSRLLRITATGESWVEVVNGSGNVVAKRVLQTGDVIEFSAAPPYTVVLGKADAAQVSVRGQPFDTAPYARSNVARFEVK